MADKPLFDFGAALQRLGDAEPATTVFGGLSRKGQKIFNDDDLRAARSPLAQLVRLFLIELDMTWEELRSKHRERCLADRVQEPNISSSFGNLKKALYNPEPTLGFVARLFYVLGYDLTQIKLVITSRDTGEARTLSGDDVARRLTATEMPMLFEDTPEETTSKPAKSKKKSS